MTASEAADKVIDKILGSTVPKMRIGVFVSKTKTSIQMTKPTSEVFSKALTVRLADFVGVYDAAISKEHLVDDLVYCGMAR